VDNGIVTIQGKEAGEGRERKKIHRIERFYGNFVRSFTLPDNVERSQNQGYIQDGMLTLQIPKAAEAKPKSIEVKVE